MSVKSAALAITIIAASAIVPAIALAAAPPITITLASAVEKPAKLILANGVFECKESSCVSTSNASVINESTACAQVAKRYGAVSAFAAGARKLDEAKLAKCNASAKK